MSPEPQQPDDEFATRLEACDELLRKGDVSGSSILPTLASSEEMRDRLERGLDCVKRLKKLFPGHSSAGRGSRSRSHRGKPSWGEMPSSIGRFQIQKELGRGAYGVVFLAHDPVLGRDIALKLPRADVLVDPKLRERFSQEARAAASLNHPHLVQVYEAGEIGPVCYIAAAYCPGESLAEWIKRQKDLSSPHEAAALIATLADAVEHAHQKGVLHRDLKPGNVMLSPKEAGEAASGSSAGATKLADFIPRITDFGLAKMESSDIISQTHSGSVLGTPAYMAPEQASGKNKAITHACDIYALGAILYELLTGRPPFQGDSPWDTLQQVQTREPASPSKLRWKTPRDLETICLKCLEKEPARRYANAAQLADDLRRFISGETIRARPVSATEHAVKWAKRKPAIAGLLAAVVVVTLIGFVGVTWQWQRATSALDQMTDAFQQKNSALTEKDSAYQTMNQALKETKAAVQEKDSALTAKQTALESRIQALADKDAALIEKERQRAEAEANSYSHIIASAHHEWLSSSPKTSAALLQQCPPQYRHWEWKYLNRITQSELLSFRGHKLAVLAVAGSHDGKFIASGSGPWGMNKPGEFKLWDATTGTELWSQPTPGPVYNLTFNRDDSLLVTASSAGVQFWDVATQQERQVLQAPSVPANDVAVSHDGVWLAVGGWNRHVTVWDLCEGTQRYDFVGHKDFVTSVSFSPKGDRLASSSRDGTTRLWNLTSTDPNVGPTVLEASIDVRRAAWNRDGSLLATAGYDQSVKLWNVATGREQLLYSKHEEPLVAVAFSPDGMEVASGDTVGYVRVWDARTGVDRLTLRCHDSGVYDLEFTPDGRKLITTGGDQVVKLWDLNGAQQYQPLTEIIRDIRLIQDPRSLAIRADGTWAAYAVGNNAWLCNLLTIDAMPAHRQLTGHRDYVTGVSFSDDNKWLATSSRDQTVRLWQAPSLLSGQFTAQKGLALLSGQEPEGPPINFVREIKGHVGAVNDVAFQPRSHLLVTAGADKTVRIWDADSGRELRKLNQHTNSVLKVATDGNLIASADLSGTLILWNAADGQEVGRSSGGGDTNSRAIGFSQNGQWLAATNVENQIRVWDLRRLKEQIAASGRVHFDEALVVTLLGHNASVPSVSFSSDGRRLVSTSRDATVRIWDLPSGRPLLKLDPQSLAYQALFTPSENSLLTAAHGVQCWDASEPNLESRMARLKTIDGEMRQWHRQQAARARTNSQWEASLFHWNHAIELQSDDPGQYWDRSWMKMYLAQWAGAAADLGQAVEGNPKSIDMHFHRHAALLIAGDVTGYREARTQMIQRFEPPSDWFVAYLAARMAALAPGTPDEAAQMLRFADTMLKTHSTHPSSLHTVAIANYRAGRIELAAEKAHAALVAKPDWNAQVLNHLVLALAYNKLHNATEARRHYAEAMKWIETAQALPIAQNPQRLGLHSVDWLTCLVLRREAETELGIEPKVILPH